MLQTFRQLDRLLRGEATTIDALREGVRVSASSLIGIIFLLGATYGACMGMFAVTGSGSNSWMQIVASMVKLPMLFLYTLAITFPSLYVFNALVGSRLTFTSLIRLLVGAMAVMMAVLASLGPIIAFFALSTTSYAFMVVLNVLVCAAAGILGLSFLLQTLHRIGLAEAMPPSLPEPAYSQDTPSDTGSPDYLGVLPARVGAPGALDAIARQHPQSRNVRSVFRIWIVVFGLVGAQMSWVMRPFIGAPNKEFTFFRERQGNFFEGVITKIKDLASPSDSKKPSRNR